MFKVMIMGESAIILAIAGLAYIFLTNTKKTQETLLEKFLEKSILIGMVLMAIVIFVLSFQGVRAFLKYTF